MAINEVITDKILMLRKEGHMGARGIYIGMRQQAPKLGPIRYTYTRNIYIPLLILTLTLVNIPSYSTFLRLIVVTYTLLLEDDDDYAPNYDNPLESRSAVSGLSDLDRYDKSAVSLEDNLSELSLSNEAPNPIATA